MTFEVKVSGLFARQFRRLPAESRRRLHKGFAALGDDPLQARPGADIKRLAGTNPHKFRLRVGEYRIIYTVSANQILLIELFTRSRGYRFD